MTKLVHSMIRVLNETASVQFYHDTFGLEVVDRLDFEREHVHLRRQQLADARLQLLRGQHPPAVLVAIKRRPRLGGRLRLLHPDRGWVLWSTGFGL